MKIITFLLIGCGILTIVNCEISINVNIKNVVNVISDKFISFQVDFFDFYDNFSYQKQLNGWGNLVSPSYIKFQRFPVFLKKFPRFANKVNETNILELFEKLDYFKITPVIIIDYNLTSFEPLHLLEDLKVAKDLKIKNCVWQLGSNQLDLNDMRNMQKYSDDIRTMKILCESVRKDKHLNWEVAAVGSFLKNQPEKDFQIAGYDWKEFSSSAQSRDKITTWMDKESSFLSKTSAPIWGNVIPSIDDIINHQTAAAMFYSSDDNTRKYISRTGCDHVCLYEGLLFAQVLGDSARNGFDVLYFKDDIKNYNSLVSTAPLSNLKSKINMKQSIMMLFKKLIGTKVFNVKLTKNSINTKQMNFFGFCSKQMNGAITMMGINYSNMRGKFNLKLSSQINQNAVVLQYLMTISDGQILLNNEPFNGDSIIPSYKFKKSTKNSIIFTLPPYSIGFWTVKNAKISECLNLDYTEMEMETEVQETSSSADLLLQQLLKKVFESQPEDLSTKRVKRQIGSNMQFLPKLDLDFPFKFPTASPNQKSLRDVLFNKNTDIYKLNSPNSQNEKDLLKSSDNDALPEGDVYLLINDGGPEYPEVPVEEKPNDYVTGEAVNVLNRKSNGKKRKQNVKKITTTPEPVSIEQDDHASYVPYDYDESKTLKTSKQSSKKTPKVEVIEEGELWEMEKPIYTPNIRNNDQMKSSSNNVEMKVMKELEPTYRQSKAALMAAKKKWNKNQIMELLKDADLEEVDKSQFKSTDDYEIIDLTEKSESTEYQEEDYHDDDDDDFFKSEEKFHLARHRRDISENEIRKYNYVDDYISSPYDIEDDILIPSHNHVYPFKSTTPTSTTQHPKDQTTQATPKSKAYKAVDFFSQSLADVVSGVHSQILGWLNIFVDPQFEDEKTMA
ncbi:unnamed protein product [Diamesa serratosioi]